VAHAAARERGHSADSIARVAFALFRERGYDATSVDLIAQRVGVTKAAIYYHFPGREAILEHGVTRALDALFGSVADARRTCGNMGSAAALEQVLRAAVRAELEHLDEVTVLLRLRGNTATEKRIVKRRQEFTALFGDLLRSAAENGEVRADVTPDVAARLILGMANSLTDWVRPRGSASQQEIVEALVRIALGGLIPGYTSAPAGSGPIAG
jgi:AcrR family transcriptional regulator